MGFLKRIGKHISRAQRVKETPPAEEEIEQPIIKEEPKKEIMPQPMEEKEEIGIPLAGLKDRPHKTETIKAPISELQQVNEKFPLVTINYKGAETVMVWANIVWDQSINSLRYILQEPLLNKKEEAILLEVKDLLQDKLDIDFSKIRTEKAFNFLIQKFYTIIDELGYKLTEEQKVRMQYYIYRDFMGLGKIEALMHDENIEDISCDGIDIPIFIYHRNPKYSQMRTNITFKSKEELDSFVLRLAQKSGKTLTIAEPLLDASLPDGSRIQATIGTDIARRGSNFTIRKFTSKPMTPVHLMNYGTCSAELFAYLWIAMENRLSVLIGGSTATGKTTFLNALSLFIKPELKIVSIEDTPELRLPHPNWVPEVSRSGYGAMKYGEVSMFSLLKTALRQRPDFVIVGEVRGEEAYVMFQGMASIPHGESVIFIDKNGSTRTTPINEIKNFEKTFSITENPGVALHNIKELVEHTPRTQFLKIKTKRGREVTVTPNHSLLTIKDGKIAGIVCDELAIGDEIVIPGILPSGYNDLGELNLTELEGIRVFAPDLIKRAVDKLGYESASEICKVKSISDYYANFAENKPSALDARAFNDLMKTAEINYNLQAIAVKFDRKSESMNGNLRISQELLRLIGYYISEGSLNTARKNNSIALYNKNEEILDDMRHCINIVAGKNPTERITKGFGECTELRFNHKIIFELLKQYCNIGSKNKKVPDFVFGLSKEKIGQVLSALYAGDGNVREKGFTYSTISKELADGVIRLLLVYGIVSTASKRKNVYEISFYKQWEQAEFMKYAKPVGKRMEVKNVKPAVSSFYLDKIKSINKLELEQPVKVYDFNVPGPQNYLGGFGGIFLHNTGHAGMGTLHADNLPSVIDRLTTKPIDLPKAMLDTLDLIVFIITTRKENAYVRRVSEVVEIIGYDYKTGELKTNISFKWNPDKDEFEMLRSVLLEKIKTKMAYSIDRLIQDIENRTKLLKWLQAKNILDYREVAKYISLYYANPEEAMELVT